MANGKAKEIPFSVVSGPIWKRTAFCLDLSKSIEMEMDI